MLKSVLFGTQCRLWVLFMPFMPFAVLPSCSPPHFPFFFPPLSLQEETDNMLKSILYGTQCRVHIHFMVSGEPEVSALTGMMESIDAPHLVPLPSPDITGIPRDSLSPLERKGYMNNTQSRSVSRKSVVYSLHFIPAEWVLEQAKGLQMYPLDHHAGIPGMSKFFMPEILWQVCVCMACDCSFGLFSPSLLSLSHAGDGIAFFTDQRWDSVLYGPAMG